MTKFELIVISMLFGACLAGADDSSDSASASSFSSDGTVLYVGYDASNSDCGAASGLAAAEACCPTDFTFVGWSPDSEAICLR